MADDFMKQVRSSAPFPWRHVVAPNGVVIVLDATNKEVPMFLMLDFVKFITNVIQNQKAQEVAA